MTPKLVISAIAIALIGWLGLRAVVQQPPEVKRCNRFPGGTNPIKARGLHDVVAIEQFGGVLLGAIKKDGSIWTWDGAWNDGWESCNRTPKLFSSNPHAQSVVAITSGQSHQLALQPDGRVWGFLLGGYVFHRELGSAGRGVREIPKLKNITAIAAGGSHSLALQSNGQVFGWGANDCGQLGFAKQGSPKKDAPVHLIHSLSDITGIAAGFRHSLALSRDGTVWELGNYSNPWFQSNSTPPDPSWFYCGETYEPWQGKQSDSREHAIPKKVPGLENIAAIETFYAHNLAIKKDGTVWGWGANNCGEAGSEVDQDSGSGVLVYRPIRVNGLNDVVAVATGKQHSLALRSDGTVWAWGDNYVTQLGSHPKQKLKQNTICLARRSVPFRSLHTSVPVMVPGLPRITAITAGSYFSAALDANGDVWIWGDQGVR